MFSEKMSGSLSNTHVPQTTVTTGNLLSQKYLTENPFSPNTSRTHDDSEPERSYSSHLLNYYNSPFIPHLLAKTDSR